MSDSKHRLDQEPPPLHPKLPPGELEKMSLDEQADYLGKVGQAAVNRYGGRPDLFLKENPQLDFRNPPKKNNPAA